MTNGIPIRAFKHITVIGIILSMAGVLLDLDHLGILLSEDVEGRWFHYLAIANPTVFVLYAVVWGIIQSALILGWVSICMSIENLHKEIKK